MARWTLSVMAAALLAMLVGGVWWEAGWESGGYRRGIALVKVGQGDIVLDVQHFTPPLSAAIAEQMYDGFWCRRGNGGMHWRPHYWVSRYPGLVRRILFIPIWMPLVLVAGAAGFCWRRHVRRRRRDRIIKAGGCPHCGYDLRGLEARGETRGEGTEAQGEATEAQGEGTEARGKGTEARGEGTETRAVCPECGR